MPAVNSTANHAFRVYSLLFARNVHEKPNKDVLGNNKQAPRDYTAESITTNTKPFPLDSGLVYVSAANLGDKIGERDVAATAAAKTLAGTLASHLRAHRYVNDVVDSTTIIISAANSKNPLTPQKAPTLLFSIYLFWA